jgi:hypothetical protein
MNRVLYRTVGLLFIGIGMLLFLNSAAGITGYSVFDGLNSISSSILGALLLAVGIIFWMASRGTYEGRGGLEKKANLVRIDEFTSRVSAAVPDKEKAVIVLDSSAIMTYEPWEISKMLKRYKMEGKRVVIPESVVDEIHNKRMKDIVRRNSDVVPAGINDIYSRGARKILDQTRKPKYRRKVYHLLDEIGSGEVEFNELTPKEKGQFNDAVKRLSKSAKGDGIGLDIRSGGYQRKANLMKDYLDRHFAVSDTDVDVLSTALVEVRDRGDVVIGEKDSDFANALDVMKKSRNHKANPRLKKLSGGFKCVDPYKD